MTDATVFVVDDDPAARDSLCAALECRGLNVRAYPSAESFLADIDGDRPGCLVLDIRMEPMDGLQLQDELRERGSRLPSVVVTAYPEVAGAVRSMSGGALTYIPKPVPDDELIQYVRRAIEMDQRRREKLRRRSELSHRFSRLTANERQVLARLLSGCANKQIAAELQVGLRTVELRRAKLFEKTGARSLAELVRLKIEFDILSDSDTLPAHAARPRDVQPS